MTGQPASPSEPVEPEVVDASENPSEAVDDDLIDESIEHPAKVMRVGTMMRQLLEEVRSATLDEPSRDRLREIYETSVAELGAALSVDLREELGRLALPFADDVAPTSDELRIAQAQLVGWLEGGLPATSVSVIDPYPSDWLQGTGVLINQPLPAAPANSRRTRRPARSRMSTLTRAGRTSCTNV